MRPTSSPRSVRVDVERLRRLLHAAADELLEKVVGSVNAPARTEEPVETFTDEEAGAYLAAMRKKAQATRARRLRR